MNLEKIVKDNCLKKYTESNSIATIQIIKWSAANTEICLVGRQKFVGGGRGCAPAWDYSQPTANDKQGDPADRKKTVFGLFDMKTIQYDPSIILN